MTPDLRAALINLALALTAIIVPLIVIKLRRFGIRDFIGLHRPPARLFALMIALWIAWMAVTELLLLWMDTNPDTPPAAHPIHIILLRLLAIGIIGPIAEEMVFRGILYGRLSPWLGAAATIIVLAAVFAAIHTRYEWSMMTLVFIDGLFFGYARHKTGSVYTPMTMHAMGNLVSLFQSMS